MIQRGKVDGTSDLEERLNHYIAVERENAVNSLAEEEEISSSVLNLFLKEYDYLQKSSRKSYKSIEREASRTDKDEKSVDEDFRQIA